MAYQKFRGHNPDARTYERYHRQFKHQAKSKAEFENETEIFANGEHRVG